ncbi:antitoxin CcdA [Solimonas aquatica]|uniref:Antitoxin CcdA n=1 Tax=Solimonas aquatica TaxID=489703 RepID=A0A1H9EZ12_9GAMM|nr:type II toxin-antitoxin system CcdA family antitoxin [Solimonas aquatica]SEQ30228.1 antitoxin CcdA [Solimonas aquatica]
MSTASYSSEPRRRLNLSIRETLIQEARKAQLNLSRFLEEKLEQALREERGRRWQEENREAIEFHRERIAREGMWNKDLISF